MKTRLSRLYWALFRFEMKWCSRLCYIILYLVKTKPFSAKWWPVIVWTPYSQKEAWNFLINSRRREDKRGWAKRVGVVKFFRGIRLLTSADTFTTCGQNIFGKIKFTTTSIIGIRALFTCIQVMIIICFI